MEHQKHLFLVCIRRVTIAVSLLTLFRPGFFYRLRVRRDIRDSLMILRTIEASPMKLCTAIVLLKAYQNTKRNFPKSDLWRHNDVITKNNGKIRTSGNHANGISFER